MSRHQTCNCRNKGLLQSLPLGSLSNHPRASWQGTDCCTTVSGGQESRSCAFHCKEHPCCRGHPSTPEKSPLPSSCLGRTGPFHRWLPKQRRRGHYIGSLMLSEKHTHPKHTFTPYWPPYHACGLGIEVLHDILNAVFDILQELFGNTGLRVQLRNAEMNAGEAGERLTISPVYSTTFSEQPTAI